jgi:glycosyltransferase involved in cell wall biosynthesis
LTHIVFIVPGFPADESDSQCIPALQTFVKNLIKTKHYSISVITLYYPQFKKKYEWHGTKVYSLAGKPGLINKIPILFKVYTTFHKINRENPVTIIHSFWLQDTSWVARKLSQKYHIPHLSTAMGQDVLRKNKYLFWMPLDLMKIIVLSPFHQNTLSLHKGKKQTQIVPWGIDPSNFPQINSKRNIDLIGVGNLTALKNYSLLIEVVELLVEKFPNLKAVLIGDGPEKAKLQQLLLKKKIGDHITLVGAVPRDQVLLYLSRSKVLFHPSTYESFGLVFAEALQLGVKIVSKKVGIAESGDNWYIFNNEEEMMRMTEDLLRSPSISKSINKYLIQDTISAYEAVYQKLIGIKREK